MSLDTPRSFIWNDRRYEIEEIVDRWYQASRDPGAAAYDYFKVRAANDSLFIIRMDCASFAWYLVKAIAPESTE